MGMFRGGNVDGYGIVEGQTVDRCKCVCLRCGDVSLEDASVQVRLVVLLISWLASALIVNTRDRCVV